MSFIFSRSNQQRRSHELRTGDCSTFRELHQRMAQVMNTCVVLPQSSTPPTWPGSSLGRRWNQNDVILHDVMKSKAVIIAA